MLRRESRSGIEFLHFEHGRANALDLEFCRGLQSTLEELRATPTRALVVTGRGTIFSAGVDLPRILSGGAKYVLEFLPVLTQAIEAMVRLPMPVVAALNGHAIAGGCILALAADHAVAARGSGRIGVPELLVGVPFPRIGLELVRARVGSGTARRLTLSGQAVPFEEATGLGLIDECVDAAGLIAHATAVAERLAAIPAASFAIHKRQLRAELDALIGVRDLDRDVTMAWSRPEVLEEVASFVRRTLHK